MTTGLDPVRTTAGLQVHAPLQRRIRYWSGRLLLLNTLLFGIVWLLYGDLRFRGYGEQYFKRVSDLWLTNGWPAIPGIENVLLPALAAAFSRAWTAIGFDFTPTTFILFAAVPNALFIYGIAAGARRLPHGGPVLAVAATLTLYTSGIVPYMTTWGGSVDGLMYLALLPVFIWPESIAVFAAAAIVQALNHYAGVISLILFAFVWHTLRALDRPDRRDAIRYWLVSFVPRLILAVGLLLAFIWFWESRYPDAARMRQAAAAAKWDTLESATGVIQEVLGPFPWTLLSTLKLALVPTVALMWAPGPRRRLRALAVATPFAVAAVLTFVFVDVTRMAMMLVIPAWLVMLHAAGGTLGLQAEYRRRFRRLILATALLNLLVPNYYVNNGAVIIPPPKPIQALIAIVIGPRS